MGIYSWGLEGEPLSPQSGAEIQEVGLTRASCPSGERNNREHVGKQP